MSYVLIPRSGTLDSVKLDIGDTLRLLGAQGPGQAFGPMVAIRTPYKCGVISDPQCPVLKDGTTRTWLVANDVLLFDTLTQTWLAANQVHVATISEFPDGRHEMDIRAVLLTEAELTAFWQELYDRGTEWMRTHGIDVVNWYENVAYNNAHNPPAKFVPYIRHMRLK